MVVRHLPILRQLVITREEPFVIFIIFGLAFSLISSASRAIRKKDTLVLILAATVVWGIFVEPHTNLGMVRFLIFASLITLGTLMAIRILSYSAMGVRVLLGGVVPGALCGIGGFAYNGLVASQRAAGDAGRRMLLGFSWGLLLGFAVGLGIAIGSEIIKWTAKKVE